MKPLTLPSFRRSAAVTGLAITALLPVATGCGSDDATTSAETSEADASSTMAETTTTDGGGDEGTAGEEVITVTDAWARSTAATAANGALYFTITSSEDDVLTAVTIDASVAESVEIHETVPADDHSTHDHSTDDHATDDHATDDSMADGSSEDDASEDDASGDAASGDAASEDAASGDMAMTMQELPDGLELPAGEPVVLEPGGYHVMLMGLVEPLQAGSELEITLEFAEASPQTMLVAVMDSAP
ncbi:MAG: copper chaperone PCu(A)C [Acidimicrobiales bacterium]